GLPQRAPQNSRHRRSNRIPIRTRRSNELQIVPRGTISQAGSGYAFTLDGLGKACSMRQKCFTWNIFFTWTIFFVETRYPPPFSAAPNVYLHSPAGSRRTKCSTWNIFDMRSG